MIKPLDLKYEKKHINKNLNYYLQDATNLRIMNLI